ncbi:MAG: hypothetical protein RBS73_04770 [Prolixibacteraceae bacterium]|jgi:outer membrane biosynthesis protein TonB|nr:hypothetical protein [Prolixibacteraceae bacterium]
MSRVKKLYHQYIYGLMGTLIFHILLFSAFLVAEIDFKKEIREEAILIDFSTPIEEEEKVKQEQGNERNTPSTQAERSASVSNRAVNDARKNDAFFDKEYLNDVQSARKLVQDVNRQLSKKVADIGDFDMPAITTEGVDPDSIKNTVYSGKSNIHYYLENRYHLRLLNPVYLAKGGGKITVDITVDRSGNVIKAEPRANTGIKDPMLPEYARSAALRTLFNADSSAPKIQNGTITYTFVAQ